MGDIMRCGGHIQNTTLHGETPHILFLGGLSFLLVNLALTYASWMVQLVYSIPNK